MKQRSRNCLIAVLSAALCAVAVWAGVSPSEALADGDGGIVCQKAPSYGRDYLAAYQVPTSMFTYGANGGGSVANAFDGNWNSSWISGKDNVNGFVNNITVTFDREVTIDRIVYASDSTRSGYGYPAKLKIYSLDGEADSVLCGECVSAPTADRVVFTMSEPLTATGIVFEYAAVNTAHKYVASAKEIVFLQPESESANDALDLFTDYTQLTVKDEYRSELARIREDVKDLLNYESALKPLLDRADSVVNDEVHKDGRFEFSTDPSAQNVIERRGNLIGYAKDVLKVNAYGYTTNRQVTGLGAKSGDTITVYVDAPNAKDPLPEIVFTQACGYWQNWRASRSLVRGKNVFTVPEFLVEPNGVGGGPIYIANGYTKAQQSTDIKIYIEGGFFLPTFRFGDDEQAFKDQLKEYEERRRDNPTEVVDVCEVVGDHFINTTRSSKAYAHYITGTASPQKNTENWERYMTGLLAFDGISMDPEDEHFDERNLHLPVNFRIAHWSGYAAYAVGEHIGLVSLGHDNLTNFGAPGWGLSHEIGHMIDLGERTKAETTNNMFAVFGDAFISKTIRSDKAQHIVSPAALYPDETATDYNYFHKNGYSVSQWWNLEAAYPGFWGKLDNTYRYYDRAAAFAKAGVTTKEEQDGLTKTEKMVYFSSIATGIDLGYYYERYGFGFDSKPFKIETASSAYKKLVEQAIADEVLSTRQYKYWYFDVDQYFHDVDERACYSSSSGAEIRDIWKNGDQYTLVLPQPANKDRHLGYEIKEYRDGNWYVIGFTHSESFTDTTAYPDGYVPKYKVCAYDRQLNSSRESAEKSFTALNQTDVCRIGDVYYDSLAEAVAAANAGDTVYLCANTKESGIAISKNLTVLPDPSLTADIVITRHSTNAVFTLSSGTFALGAAGQGVKVVLEGFSFLQAGPLIKIAGGTAVLNNVVLRNNASTGDGGAIAVTAAGGKLNATDCEFIGNTGRNGGAVYNVGVTSLTRCRIADNVASENGGAIANYSGGVLAIADCTLTGNRATKNGGALTIDGKTALAGTSVTDNAAGSLGGGLYIAVGTNAANRTVSVNGGAVTGNTAQKGSVFYLHAGFVYLGGTPGAALSGEIYKHQGDIRLNTADIGFSQVVFYLSSIAEGTVLFSANGSVTFADELPQSIRVYLGAAKLNEAKTAVLVDSSKAEITLVVNGQRINVDHTPDWEYTLPETVDDVPEGKRFAGWEVDGVRYNGGNSVVIGKDTEIVAVYEDASPTEESGGSVAGLVIGIIAGVLAVAGAAVAAVIVLKKKKARK